MVIVVIAATNLSSENCDMNARTMNKIEFVYRIARFGFLLALGVLALTALFATAAPVKTDARSNPNAVATDTTSLKPPDKGQIPVAFLISDGAVVIDFCGPWEVFQDVRSRVAKKCRSVCIRWPKRRNRSAPVAECRSFQITRSKTPRRRR